MGISYDNQIYRPGEQVRHGGIYRVLHAAHRLPHEVTVPEGTVLPQCARCGQRVRFLYLREAPFIRDDYDFAEKRGAAGGGD